MEFKDAEQFSQEDVETIVKNGITSTLGDNTPYDQNKMNTWVSRWRCAASPLSPPSLSSPRHCRRRRLQPPLPPRPRSLLFP